MNKTDAVEFAKRFGWTKADAERAYADIDLKNSVERDLVHALLRFAGPELLERQRLQGAQRGLVTKKANRIEEIETEFAAKTKKYKKIIQTQRSVFVEFLGKFYSIAQRFGMKEPFIESMLNQYSEYLNSPNFEEDDLELRN